MKLPETTRKWSHVYRCLKTSNLTIRNQTIPIVSADCLVPLDTVTISPAQPMVVRHSRSRHNYVLKFGIDMFLAFIFERFSSSALHLPTLLPVAAVDEVTM